MGFFKEVYSDNRAGLVVVFGRENSDNFFDGDSVEEAMKYFGIYKKNDELFIKTEDEKALETIGIQHEDAKAARLALDSMLSVIPDEIVENVAVLFPSWKEGAVYTANQRVRYNKNVYKVLQAHTSQSDWTPDKATSLFTALLVDEESDKILEWLQPDSTNGYMIGDKVKYNGKIYESLIDNNVWSPEAYPTGWKEVVSE